MTRGWKIQWLVCQWR